MAHFPISLATQPWLDAVVQLLTLDDVPYILLARSDLEQRHRIHRLLTLYISHYPYLFSLGTHWTLVHALASCVQSQEL